MISIVEMSHKMGRVNPAMPNAGKVLELIPLVLDETIQ